MRVSADGQASLSTLFRACYAYSLPASLRATLDASRPRASPRVRVSREFLDDFFAKFNIDGTQESNKASVAEKLRHTLGTPKLEGLVEAVAEAVLSHVEANGAGRRFRALRRRARARSTPNPNPARTVTLDAVQNAGLVDP